MASSFECWARGRRPTKPAMGDELLPAALAGVGQTGTAGVAAEGPADALAEGMGLLLRAGLRDVYRRAGYVSVAAPDPFPPAPDVRETICPPSVASVLGEIVERGSSVLSPLPEGLRAVARRGWVLPPVLLVASLSCPLRPAEVLAVLGARGRWLAALNGDWTWAVTGERVPLPAEIERIWAEGTKGERVALIRRLRAMDASSARERVAAGFGSEPADLRQDLVRALEVNLSNDDEPFLEAALDDRSKGVRQAAAILLARLPDSAFVARMAARAQGLLSRRRLRRDITLLPAPDPPADWRRDGIVPAASAGSETGYARTVRVLSSLPASVIARHLDVSPDEVLAAADRYDATRLIEAWARNASPGERDALLPLLWDRWWEKPLKRRASDDALKLLARGMPPDALRQRMLRLLDDPPAGTERFILQVLTEMGEIWPGDISRAAIDRLRQWLERTRRRDRNAGDWLPLIRLLATRATPGTIDQSLDLLADIERAKVLPAWGYELRQPTELLRLRQKFRDAMAATISGS